MHIRQSIPLWLRAPRNMAWLLAALALLAVIAWANPAQLPVVLYKVGLVAQGIALGYWADRALFPYARPDSYLARDWRLGTPLPEGDADYPIVPQYVRAFCTAQLRRALIVGAVVLGLTLGL